MVLEYGNNPVVTDTPGIAGLMVKQFELISVPSIQAICRSKPHESTIILVDCLDRSLGQAIFNRQPFKTDRMANTQLSVRFLTPIGLCRSRKQDTDKDKKNKYRRQGIHSPFA